MHEETTSRSVPSSAAASTTQPTDPNSAELQISYSSSSSGGGSGAGAAMEFSSAAVAALASQTAPGGAVTTAGSGGSGGGGTGGSASAASGAAGGGSDLPDTKEGVDIEELCPVCGDKVSGYHYGLLTCESCKGFFKRTVQNKKVYTCVADRSCHIDKTQRKRCPYCRFQKCLGVGMKLEAVRADRMRGGRNKFGPMYKRDRARKLQMLRQRQLAIQIVNRSHPMGSAGASGASGVSGTLGSEALNLGYSTQGFVSSAGGGSNLHIKQEIQIPQVSSLTSSPDSSPSPMGGATQSGAGPAAGGNGGGGGQGGQGVQGTTSAASAAAAAAAAAAVAAAQMGGGGNAGPLVLASGAEHKLWSSPNSTTPSPHSLSPKAFHYEGVLSNGGEGGGGAAGAAAGASNSAAPGTPSASVVKVSPLIRDFVAGVDDREWQNSLFGLLQNQTYNQCEVDLFELMCKVLDQNLFSQVDWARNSVFFKDLKVDDQMKLLQHSWSDMLVLDHMHQRMHNNLPDEMALPNGQKFDLLCLGLLGVPSLADHFSDLTAQLEELKFDVSDYICIKFLLLLNPEVRGLMNWKHVHDGHDQVQQALLDYTVTCYPQIQDKFAKLLMVLPEIHQLASRGEDHLYHKHCTGGAPTQTLLMEMLHAKRK
ncbi:nuclear hormone receptor FTZ-F1 isoform X2 [Ischnura elegans]|uniref:nuclear hormone receptor FTZ-F1 isoform X2 n=1 Tax=Ischnura elegans TaxID=197161 RepID=UPI001ED8B54D|nr:nuclear hormone receptor FTZ-F1 isoform X2 [Ischnura elegans]